MSTITGSDVGSFSSENISVEIHNQQKQELLKNFHGFNSLSSTLTVSNGSNIQLQQPQLPIRRKRNLPGNPDPSAEVIALSPKTLLATNRFMCEICKKGFQRDQNLQLHRRGHNLPWKLKQRSSDEIRKKVYICPEPSCVHNDPARALGDLTGIKKHFFRKHGEKKWKCERCSKKYAVQSDWKAHSKICGTKEYKCDCGTVFSRRDSFITHRAFCDALADHQETNKTNQQLMSNMIPNLQTQMSQLSKELMTSMPMIINDKMINPSSETSDQLINQSITDIKMPITTATTTTLPQDQLLSTIPSKPMNNMVGSIFSRNLSTSISQPVLFEGNLQSFGVNSSSINTTTAAHLSATALLQKAAQMGASVSGNNINCNNFITSMPSSTFGLSTSQNEQHIPQVMRMDQSSTTNVVTNQLMKKNPPEISSSQLFTNVNGIHNLGMFSSSAGMFNGFNNTALLKSTEQNNENGNGNSIVLHGNGTDVTTVDFLGIGRSARPIRNFEDQQKQLQDQLQQKQQEMGFGFIGQSVSLRSSNQVDSNMQEWLQSSTCGLYEV